MLYNVYITICMLYNVYIGRQVGDAMARNLPPRVSFVADLMQAGEEVCVFVCVCLSLSLSLSLSFLLLSFSLF